MLDSFCVTSSMKSTQTTTTDIVILVTVNTQVLRFNFDHSLYCLSLLLLFMILLYFPGTQRHQCKVTNAQLHTLLAMIELSLSVGLFYNRATAYTLFHCDQINIQITLPKITRSHRTPAKPAASRCRPAANHRALGCALCLRTITETNVHAM